MKSKILRQKSRLPRGQREGTAQIAPNDSDNFTKNTSVPQR